ncbi:hypothetical protein SAMN05421841_3540 [Chryseobacterium wanjuense]|jgi:hypothetical protein|uniref:PLAT/LH2 domain-containing protein n=1 Tax=Chryseobacterium wanjuense TaxID=356305 RepID=A0A1I0S054_9FLAO|nr:hypothetical protein [Chryseobacterium wanjuense]SEW47505.1 hypothetical protein SAMN05421841_3540 [Chryseobacterium wanjuense]
MKQFYKSNLLRLSFLFAVLFSVISVVNSCKDDDKDEYEDHIIQFESKIVNGTGSGTGTFKTIVTQVGTSQNTIFDPTGTNWASGEQFVSSSQSQLNLAANAVLPNADSKLIVNIWVDGEVAKSDTVIGSGTKSAAVAHSFLEL